MEPGDALRERSGNIWQRYEQLEKLTHSLTALNDQLIDEKTKYLREKSRLEAEVERLHKENEELRAGQSPLPVANGHSGKGDKSWGSGNVPREQVDAALSSLKTSGSANFSSALMLELKEQNRDLVEANEKLRRQLVDARAEAESAKVDAAEAKDAIQKAISEWAASDQARHAQSAYSSLEFSELEKELHSTRAAAAAAEASVAELQGELARASDAVASAQARGQSWQEEVTTLREQKQFLFDKTLRLQERADALQIKVDTMSNARPALERSTTGIPSGGLGHAEKLRAVQADRSQLAEEKTRLEIKVAQLETALATAEEQRAAAEEQQAKAVQTAESQSAAAVKEAREARDSAMEISEWLTQRVDELQAQLREAQHNAADLEKVKADNEHLRGSLLEAQVRIARMPHHRGPLPLIPPGQVQEAYSGGNSDALRSASSGDSSKLLSAMTWGSGDLNGGMPPTQQAFLDRVAMENERLQQRINSLEGRLMQIEAKDGSNAALPAPPTGNGALPAPTAGGGLTTSASESLAEQYLHQESMGQQAVESRGYETLKTLAAENQRLLRDNLALARDVEHWRQDATRTKALLEDAEVRAAAAEAKVAAGMKLIAPQGSIAAKWLEDEAASEVKALKDRVEILQEENDRLDAELQKRIAAVATNQLSRSASFNTTSSGKKMSFKKGPSKAELRAINQQLTDINTRLTVEVAELSTAAQAANPGGPAVIKYTVPVRVEDGKEMEVDPELWQMVEDLQSANAALTTDVVKLRAHVAALSAQLGKVEGGRLMDTQGINKLLATDGTMLETGGMRPILEDENEDFADSLLTTTWGNLDGTQPELEADKPAAQLLREKERLAVAYKRLWEENATLRAGAGLYDIGSKSEKDKGFWKRLKRGSAPPKPKPLSLTSSTIITPIRMKSNGQIVVKGIVSDGKTREKTWDLHKEASKAAYAAEQHRLLQDLTEENMKLLEQVDRLNERLKKVLLENSELNARLINVALMDNAMEAAAADAGEFTLQQNADYDRVRKAIEEEVDALKKEHDGHAQRRSELQIRQSKLERMISFNTKAEMFGGSHAKSDVFGSSNTLSSVGGSSTAGSESDFPAMRTSAPAPQTPEPSETNGAVPNHPVHTAPSPAPPLPTELLKPAPELLFETLSTQQPVLEMTSLTSSDEEEGTGTPHSSAVTPFGGSDRTHNSFSSRTSEGRRMLVPTPSGVASFSYSPQPPPPIKTTPEILHAARHSPSGMNKLRDRWIREEPNVDEEVSSEAQAERLRQAESAKAEIAARIEASRARREREAKMGPGDPRDLPQQARFEAQLRRAEDKVRKMSRQYRPQNDVAGFMRALGFSSFQSSEVASTSIEIRELFRRAIRATQPGSLSASEDKPLATATARELSDWYSEAIAGATVLT